MKHTDGTEKTPEPVPADKLAAEVNATPRKGNPLLAHRRGNRRVFGIRAAQGFDPSKPDTD